MIENLVKCSKPGVGITISNEGWVLDKGNKKLDISLVDDRCYALIDDKRVEWTKEFAGEFLKMK